MKTKLELKLQDLSSDSFKPEINSYLFVNNPYSSLTDVVAMASAIGISKSL
jgi:hypothetical protein